MLLGGTQGIIEYMATFAMRCGENLPQVVKGTEATL